jgi:DNA-binding transcriptional regulator YiaG
MILEVLTLPVADQAREVLAALSLNKSQLAEVLCVSRPTVYDWFDGKEPNASNSDRLIILLRLLARA